MYNIQKKRKQHQLPIIFIQDAPEISNYIETLPSSSE